MELQYSSKKKTKKNHRSLLCIPMLHDFLEGRRQYADMNPRGHFPSKELKSDFKHTLHYHEAQTKNIEGTDFHMAILHNR